MLPCKYPSTIIVKANKKQVNDGKFEVPDKRFSHVLVDIVGPLPESYGYKFLLTAICHISNYAERTLSRMENTFNRIVAG